MFHPIVSEICKKNSQRGTKVIKDILGLSQLHLYLAQAQLLSPPPIPPLVSAHTAPNDSGLSTLHVVSAFQPILSHAHSRF